MADVHVQQEPGGSAAWVWAIIALILVGVIAWFIIGGTNAAPPADGGGVNVDVNVPSAPAGGGQGGGGGGGGGGGQ
jgi:hypothetical protein